MSIPARVTIGIRTRNRNILLPRAIESVIAQTFKDWQLVVINDGGDRGAIERTVAPYVEQSDNLITLEHIDRVGHMGVTSNAVIDRPLGEFFAHHDDDDTWDPQFLARTIARMESDGEDVLSVITQLNCRSERLTEDGRIESLDQYVQNPTLEFASFQAAYMCCLAPPIATLYRSKAIELVGRFDEQIPIGDDWEYQLRVITRGRIEVIPEPLATRHERVTDDSYGNLTDRHQLLDQSVRMIRDKFSERAMREGRIDVAEVALAISELDRENHKRVNETLDHARVLRLQVGDIDHQTKQVLGLLERYDSTFRALRMLLLPIIWIRRTRNRRSERRGQSG